MQWRGSTNKSLTKLNVAKNKFNIGDLFTNGENHRGKILPDEFKVTILRESTIIKTNGYK